ncbi:hypothetical protein tinsulaeT_34870 [Thalassotalea insulae]|uniref:Methyltransferase domain-containing protein n=1 Tax=Thalassotalea insulae TaxID=2056778 RepID=A0ABQ6H003_9GAMM|nr:class I SAM-dependent methyltransferase [Thalassotalea insulae]GLX80147.1 hypothetical protein tinsulaeT_34870 [Thalassotalea insulae]
MKKQILLLSTCLLLSSLCFAADFSFTKGQRSAADLALDVQRKGPQVIELTKVSSGMTVLDLLGGGGYYSELLAEKVGNSGKVYLHNNQAYMPYIEKELAARLKDNRLANVIRYDRETDNLELADKQFDAVFFILGYHDLYHKAEGWDINKAQFLSDVLGALKSGGQLVIVDHSAVADSKTKHAQELHRIDQQYVIDELTQLGLTLVKKSSILENKQDSRMISPFKPEIRRKTDRFILVFEKA